MPKARVGKAKQITAPPKHWWELSEVNVDATSADWNVGNKADIPGGTPVSKTTTAQIEVQQVNLLGDMQLASVSKVGKYIRPPKNPVDVRILDGLYPSARLILNWTRRNP